MANKPENNKHGQNVLKSLEELENRRNKLLKLTEEMLSAYKGAMYPVDIFAIGAVKRAISTAAGFRLLVESWNMICARAMLRMQIDTALRFSSIFLVKKPHDFVVEILKGQQINKTKDKDGNKMTDAYLVSKLAPEYSWLPVVYKNLSGYVHLSEHHLFDSIEHIDDESGSVLWAITETDMRFPDKSWTEVIACFNESTDIFMKYLEGWIFTKANPEIVAKIKKKLNIK
jgi:hypothetical protein